MDESNSIGCVCGCGLGADGALKKCCGCSYFWLGAKLGSYEMTAGLGG